MSLPSFVFRAGAVSALLTSAVLFSGCRSGEPKPVTHYDLLIGGFSGPEGTPGARQGVTVYRYDTATHALTPLRENTGIRHPSWLLASEDGRRVFSVNEIDTGTGRSGEVSAFGFDAASGELSFLNKVSSEGDSPCHLGFGPGVAPQENRMLFVSNYSNGVMTTLGVAPEGRLLPASALPHAPRLSGKTSHMHSTAMVPGTRLVVVQDLGGDTVTLMDCDKGEVVQVLRLPEGTGPRHLVFDKAGRNAYVIGELNDTVTHLKYADRRLSVVETRLLGDAPGFKKGTAAAVKLSDDGRFLYASTRTPKNSIHVFAVDGEAGSIKPIQVISSGGNGPRDFSLSPDGHRLLAANQRTDEVSVFERDPDSGRIGTQVDSVKTGSPSALVWVPVP